MRVVKTIPFGRCELVAASCQRVRGHAHLCGAESGAQTMAILSLDEGTLAICNAQARRRGVDAYKSPANKSLGAPPRRSR